VADITSMSHITPTSHPRYPAADRNKERLSRLKMKGIEANQEDGVDVVRLSEAYRRRIHIVLSRKEDTGVIGRAV
jgi:hypothetical protein